MFSGYSANPVTTVIGSILWSFTIITQSFLRKCAYLNASRRSNAINTSAWPSSTIGSATFSPYLTNVTTLPPRCAIPWTSESFTSYPLSIVIPPKTLLVRSVPCPPTPTIIIFFVSAIICHLSLLIQLHRIYNSAYIIHNRYTLLHQLKLFRLHSL